jgi:hypothetical protein
MKEATVEVPRLGGDVQVRSIPPKLLRVIHAKATNGGKIDFQELMVWKLVFGLKTPSLTEVEARQLTAQCTVRVLQPIVDQIDRLSGTDEHLRDAGDHPHSLHKIIEPVTMAMAWVARFPDVAPTGARSRDSHGAKPVRRRGSRRTATTARAGPGDDPDPEPPGPRSCGCGCGASIFHLAAQARFLDSTHRKRAQRSRDREQPDRVVERRLERLTIGELTRKCRCSSEAVDIDPEGACVCVACGRPRTVALGAVNDYDAHLAEVRGWMRNERAEVRKVHRHRSARVWRTRPSRKMAAKLRKTRREYQEAAA